MRSSSATTRLVVNASRMLQKTVGVLSNPERGAAIFASGYVSRRVALWRTRVASSRSDFSRFPSVFMYGISFLMMLVGQGCRHTRLVPDMDRFSYTPPDLIPEALHNPRWVGSRRKISARCVVRATVCSTIALQSYISRCKYEKSQDLSSPSCAKALWMW